MDGSATGRSTDTVGNRTYTIQDNEHLEIQRMSNFEQSHNCNNLFAGIFDPKVFVHSG